MIAESDDGQRASTGVEAHCVVQMTASVLDCEGFCCGA